MPRFTQDHPITGFTHYGDVIQRPKFLQDFQRLKHGSLHWLVEGLGEALGVYFYVYCGVGATAAYNIGTLSKVTGLGSLLTIGAAYALGIVFAVAIASPASGGHFNPCFTIANAIWRGFPWRKVPVFIFFQILGAFFACLLVYGQYRTTFLAIEEGLMAVGAYDKVQFTSAGIAGIFALYAPATASLRDVFMNEFFVDFFLALVVWGVLDPTNFFVPPVAAPWIVGFAYAAAIWGYAPGALSANSARDIGGRLVALCIWGKPAAGGRYAAIAALTNIPATLFATVVYEFILTDTSRVIPRAQQEFFNGHLAHGQHKELSPEEVNSNDSSNKALKGADNA